MGTVRGNISSVLDRVYERARHRDASDELEFATSAAGHLDSLKAYRYCLVITYRRSGDAVPTPVWFGVDENRLFFRTSAQAGKVKRIRANGRAAVAPCAARGHPLGPAVAYAARVLDGEQIEPAEAAIQAEYGIGRRLYTRMFGRADDDTAMSNSRQSQLHTRRRRRLQLLRSPDRNAPADGPVAAKRGIARPAARQTQQSETVAPRCRRGP